MSGEEQSEYAFIWRIKNYSLCYQVNGECIFSPFFTIENIPGSQWCLKVYPKGHRRLKVDTFLSCFLERKVLGETNKPVTISYSIEIVDEKDCVLKSMVRSYKEFTISGPATAWGWDEFIATNELEKEINSWAEDVLTLRCRMKTNYQLRANLYESIACSTIEVDRCCVEWYVEMPSLFEYTECLALTISDLYDLKITLNSTEENMAILIHFKDGESKSSQQFTFIFSFFNKIGCKLGSKRARYLFENEETWKFPDFITKEWLSCCEVNASQYEFNLKCEVCVSKKSISSSIERLKFVSPCSLKSMRRNIPTSAMHNNFRNILMSKTYSDVTIRSKNDEFPAHKFVLKVQSPVFAAMFDQDMVENKTGVVDMADIDGKTLKAFLEYLYTETVDGMDDDIAKTLILTADKYEVPSLVDECASFLKPILSTENVCEIIAIADMIGCENLKSYALNFIEVNAAEILPTAAWTEWIEGNIKLAAYILFKLSAAISTTYK